MAERITTAEFRALQSVANRQCYRTFSATGNTLHSKDGCHASVLWRLERSGLIREGETLTRTQTLMALTDAGRMAKRRAEEQ